MNSEIIFAGTVFILFIYGAVIGSFLNVCIYRIPEKKSIVSPPSACPKCGNFIKWYDNIPILSYFILGRKCRFCGEKISIRYPVIEFITGLLFVLFFIKFGVEKIYFFYIIMVGYLITLALIDIDRKIVPDGILKYMLITGAVFSVFKFGGINLFEGIIGAAAGGTLLLILNYFTNGKIGEGDVKLAAVLGMCVGAAAVFDIIFYSFIAGGFVAVFLIVTRKNGRKDEIAFVPFIAAGFLIKFLLA
ncbi:MAG: prepilin peptidase [Candidatus Goldbacteria bacterium]|nr:prepilin peptidase [Candidatus Goldiibacteriota bacterium]